MASLWRTLTGSGAAAPTPDQPSSDPTAPLSATPPAQVSQPEEGSGACPYQLDFGAFAQGQHITLNGVSLVRADLIDRMKAMAGADLLVVSRDSHGMKLVAPEGDYSHGALLVDANNKGVGFWMPEAQWKTLPHSLRPTTAIDIDGQQFIRLDLTDRIQSMITEAKCLKIIAEYHGFHLMADNGDLSKGLLMVDKQLRTEGFWLPKWEYDRRGRP
eukprot:EG_transcript_17285